MFGHMYEVLNEVYLQNFLHGWVVNRETNLMSLLNPLFATVMLQYYSLIMDYVNSLDSSRDLQSIRVKNFVNRLHLVDRNSKISFQKILAK